MSPLVAFIVGAMAGNLVGMVLMVFLFTLLGPHDDADAIQG